MLPTSPTTQSMGPRTFVEHLRRWRWSLLLSVIVVGNLVVARFVITRGNAAEDKQSLQIAPVGKAAEVRSPLPIGQVVLFSSGVGYFQREGTVDGDARVDLSFDVRDINDLIKSMVVRDLDGGQVAAVSYDSNAPIERTLQSFAIDLNNNPTATDILNQARGEKIEVVLQQNNAGQPGTMTGTIVGIEGQTQSAGKDAVADVDVLNLWCADGLRSVKMKDVQRVRFLNPTIEGEFRKALETLAMSHDTGKKAVSINFSGAGKRKVRVGYVVENPIWKTSYRLVLDKEKKAAPFLQGWAVVENPTDEDWKDVRMALVSGRPISFQMDLYSPLYVPRPMVDPEQYTSLRPVAYSGGLGVGGGLAGFGGGIGGLGGIGGIGGGGLAGLGGGMPAAGAVPPSKQRQQARQRAEDGKGRVLEEDENPLKGNVEELKKLDDRMDLSGTARSIAQAGKLGDSFQYSIDRSVTLPRQKSALLPIINKDVQATRVSIYNEKTQVKHPLLGLRLKNTSGAHLMQGPITVFEGSNYAGDARIADLQPNEERLLSYAIDLGTEVKPVPSSDSGRMIAVKVVKGIVTTSSKIREKKSYTIANRNDQERTILVEHPVRNDFKLVGTEKPVETAADVYRFEVKVPAGKTESLEVIEEKPVATTVDINTLNNESVRVFLNSPVASPKVKEALEEAMNLRGKMTKTDHQYEEQCRQLNVIVEDQTRLRANIKEMPATAAAYKRYLDKFDAQETQIETYQKEIKRLQGIASGQKNEYEDFLAALNVE